MSNDLHAEGKRNSQSVGCMIMMVIVAIAIVGLLVWVLLWGRSIPAGQESKDGTPQSSIVSRLNAYV